MFWLLSLKGRNVFDYIAILMSVVACKNQSVFCDLRCRVSNISHLIKADQKVTF